MDAGVDDRLRARARGRRGAEGSGYLLTFDLAIEDNLLVCWLNGVSLEGFSHAGRRDADRAGTRLLGALRAGIVCNGLTLPAMSRVDVAATCSRSSASGSSPAPDDTRVADNDVYGLIAAAAGDTRRDPRAPPAADWSATRSC